MSLKDLIAKMDAIEASALSEATDAPYGNPYTGADAAKFNSLSPEDKEWLTRPTQGSGGKPAKPDINDRYIAARAPNKLRAVATPAAPAAPAAPTTNQPGADAGPPDATQDANPSKEFNMNWQPMVDRLNQLLDQLEKRRGQASNPTKPPFRRGTGVIPANKSQSNYGPPDYSHTNPMGDTYESISLAKDIVESFGYELDEVSDELAVGGATYAAANPAEKALAKRAAAKAGTTVAADAAAAAAKTGAFKAFAGKAASKILPGVGAAFGTADAIHRYKQGDYLGAGISGTSAALSLIPGIGWVPALALDAFNYGRDRGATPTASPEVAQQHPPAGDLPVKQLQRVIGTVDDGIFGKNSREALKAWQAQKGLTVDGIPTPQVFNAAGIKLAESFTRPQTVAEQIVKTRQKLESIYEPDPVIYMCEDGTLFIVDSEENVYDLNEAGYLQAGEEILKRGLPKASSDAKAFAQGWERIFGKKPAPNYSAGQMTATPKGAPAGITPPGASMPKPPTAPAAKSTPNYSQGQMTATPKGAPAGITPPGAGMPNGLSIGKLGAAEEKGITALSKAEQTAVKASVEAMSPAAKAKWIKDYPKTAAALAIVGGGLAGYMLGKDEKGVDPTPTPTPTPPGPSPKPNIGPTNPVQKVEMDEINQLLSAIANAEDPAVQQQLQTARIRLSRMLNDPNIGKLGTGEATPAITIPGSEAGGQGANPSAATEKPSTLNI